MTWSGDHVTNEKRYISISTGTDSTKLDRMVTHEKEPQTRNSYVLSITWSHEVMRQIKKTHIYPSTRKDDVLSEEVATHNCHMAV